MYSFSLSLLKEGRREKGGRGKERGKEKKEVRIGDERRESKLVLPSSTEFLDKIYLLNYGKLRTTIPIGGAAFCYFMLTDTCGFFCCCFLGFLGGFFDFFHLCWKMCLGGESGQDLFSEHSSSLIVPHNKTKWDAKKCYIKKESIWE